MQAVFLTLRRSIIRKRIANKKGGCVKRKCRRVLDAPKKPETQGRLLRPKATTSHVVEEPRAHAQSLRGERKARKLDTAA
jgi:hypothetical protein